MKLNSIFIKFIVLLTSSLCFSSFALSQGQEETLLNTKPVVESIDGAKTLLLLNGSKKREISAGAEIETGERIKTGSTTSATIRYPDGSKIVVATQSEYKVEEKTEGIQWNQLKAGSVRGIITKTTIPASTKPRFIIRNKAAVLGVRGTDFIMGLSQGGMSSQVHTLEGSVEVAKDEISLLSSNGTVVNEGNFVEVSPKTGVSIPQSFDKAEFLKSFNSQHSAPKSIGTETTEPITEAPSNGGPSAEFSAESTPPPPSGMPAPTKFKLPELNSAKIKDEEVKPEVKPPQAPPPKDEKGQLTLLSFQTGVFYSQMLDNSKVTGLMALWTPRFVLPFLPFLSIHGSFGGNYARSDSYSGNFVIMEYELFATVSLLDLFFIEGGMGEQIWRGHETFNAGLATVNLGLLTHIGIIDRIFFGYQVINYLPIFNQYKVGIQFGF